jgi:AmmeMemoRadiSam system protein A
MSGNTLREETRSLPLSAEERSLLLDLARRAILAEVTGGEPIILNLHSLSPRLRENGACFVTLTRRGDLRGCIGTLEPYQPLAEDVIEHAVAAATQDYRFIPVQPNELEEIEIEISRLTLPVELAYDNAQDLLGKLRPGVDGVILRDGRQRATFLPQVWEKLPDPVDFLDHLCAKMGALPGLWRHRKIQVWVYEVEEFHE